MLSSGAPSPRSWMLLRNLSGGSSFRLYARFANLTVLGQASCAVVWSGASRAVFRSVQLAVSSAPGYLTFPQSLLLQESDETGDAVHTDLELAGDVSSDKGMPRYSAFSQRSSSDG